MITCANYYRTIDQFLSFATEYWLSSLKVITIVIFIILGILVNVGVNQSHEYIGGKNWRIPGAPFVGGFGGFARVFVTASFACKLEMSFHLVMVLIKKTIRRRDGKSWYHCRRNKESFS